ncbi:unnamed protein product, partial [Rotaria sp. Silwood2]
RIQCPRYVDEQTISSTDSSNYFLSDIGEEATFDYQGTSITISVQSLIETQKLGYGDFGIVNLAEVKEYPDIKMAVKPENFRPYSEYSRYNIRSDMWALGLSALEIASNKCPLSKMTTWETIINIQTWTPELPSNLSTELQELIIWLLKTQPEDRPEKYEDILASHAIQSLPTEITKEEEEMVKIIIEHIPKIDDD